MNKRVIKAAVFDFDGTLVDASEAICLSFNAVLLMHSVEVLSDKVIRKMIGKPLFDMFEETLDHPDAELVQTCIEQYRAEFMPRSVPLTRPMPGFESMLKELDGSVVCGIATSRTVWGARHILDGLGALSQFGAIVGIDTVTHCKPHPEPVLAALKALDVSPAEAVMVGDTSDDIMAGRTAGVLSVGFSQDEERIEELRAAGADFVIQNLAVLPALLGVSK